MAAGPTGGSQPTGAPDNRAPGHSAGTQPPRGVRVGVDVGSVRVGVAISDPDGILATPVNTLARDEADNTDIDELTALVVDRDAVEVVVGLPKTLRGADGPAVRAARAYGGQVAERIAPIPVVYVDERMSSAEANRVLYERRVPGRSRRNVVDQLAAVTILQTRLDRLRGGTTHG